MLRLLLQHWQSSSLYHSQQKKAVRTIPVPLAFSDDVTKVNPIFQDDSDTTASTLSYKRARHNILADVHHDPENSSLDFPSRISLFNSVSDQESESDSTTERKSFLHSYRDSSQGSLTSNSGSAGSQNREGKLSSGNTKAATKQVGTSNVLITDPTLNKEYSKPLSKVERQEQLPTTPEIASGTSLPEVSSVDSASSPPEETVAKPSEPDRSKAPNLASFIPPPPALPFNMTNKSSLLATISEKSDSGTSKPSTPVLETKSSRIAPAPIKEPIPISDLFRAALGETRNLKPSEILRQQRSFREAIRGKTLSPTSQKETQSDDTSPKERASPEASEKNTPVGESTAKDPLRQFTTKEPLHKELTASRESLAKEPLKSWASRESLVKETVKQSTSGEFLLKESARASSSRESPPRDSKPKDPSSTEPKKLLVMMNETRAFSASSITNAKSQTETQATTAKQVVSDPVSSLKVSSSPGVTASRTAWEQEAPVRRSSTTEGKSSPQLTLATGPKRKKGGVTRGDQVPSDEGASTSSSSTSLGSTSKKGVPSSRPSQKHKNCRNCGLPATVPTSPLPGNGRIPGPSLPNGKIPAAVPGTRQRLSPVGLAKFDDYYLTAIRQARRNKSSDSLSDSLATYGSDKKLCNGCHKKIRKGRYNKANADLRYPPEGSAQDASDSFFSEDYFARSNPFADPRFHRYRRSSWASCSCDQCSEVSFNLDHRSRSFGGTDSGEVSAYRKSFGGHKARSHPGHHHHHHHGCTCSQAVTSRRVKFASAGTPPPDDPKDPKGDRKEKAGETEAKPESKLQDEAKTGEQPETKNGFAKGLQSGFTPFPWEAEDWQSFLRKKSLQRRRRRALYMGLTALVLVVLVGMAVGLVLVWLRKAK